MILEKEIQQVKPFRNNYHKAAVNLIFTGKWMIQFHSDVFKQYNLTIQQYNILRILRGRNPGATTVKLIRERMLDRVPQRLLDDPEDRLGGSRSKPGTRVLVDAQHDVSLAAGHRGRQSAQRLAWSIRPPSAW